MVLVTLCALLASGIGLPPDLMGSAPRQQDWSALAADVRVVGPRASFGFPETSLGIIPG